MSDNKQNPQQGRRLPVRKTATGNQHPVRQNKQSDNPESLYAQTVGKNGPILEQDNILHESLETFIHEKIVERPLHVKGFGAFGHFETLNSRANIPSFPFFSKLVKPFLSRSVFRSGRVIRALRIHRETFVDFQQSSIQTPESSTLFATIFQSFCCATLCVFQRVSRHYHHHHAIT